MMKFLLKRWLPIHVAMYRLTGGRIGSEIRGLNLLLLNSVGRKTGKAHTTPLAYFMDGNNYIITASSSTAFGTYPAWYYNLKTDPDTTIQVKNQVINVKAATANPAERQRLWSKLIEIAPRYEAYEKRTTHEIPMVILRPVAQIEGKG